MFRALSLPRVVMLFPVVLSLLLSLPLTVQAEPPILYELNSPLYKLNTQAGFSPTVDETRLKKLKFLARKLCSNMKYDDDVFIDRAKRIVSSFRKKFDKDKDGNKIKETSDEDILRFLNKNRSHLYCELPLGGEEHYMVYAVNNGQLQKLFSMFLNTLTTDMKVLAPNVNMVVGKSPKGDLETILDVLKRKSLEEGRSKDFVDAMNSKISQFRRMYKAKYYHELK